MQSGLWTFVALMVCAAGAEYLMGGHVNNGPPKSLLEELESPPSLARTAQLDDPDLDLDAEESTVAYSTSDDKGTPRYHLPYPFAFNGGRPFSLEKDPITGKIDFEKAPPVKALNFTARYPEAIEDDGKDVPTENDSYLTKKKTEKEAEDVSPNEINPYSPNFHDFLNLPVHYSSDKYGKDKYPLISSSYANTKVQSGSNSYSIYNHKPYHGGTVVYYPTRKPYVPKTTTTTTTSTTTTTTTTAITPTTTLLTTSSSTATTPRPTTISTTTTTSTTTATPPATLASTKVPIATTWKPQTSTPKRFTDHLEEYDDALPIEKLQSSTYSNSHQGPNNIAHVPQTKPPGKQEEYDTYEDYEIGEGEDYGIPMKESTNEIVKSSTLPTTVSVNATTTAAPETTFSSPTTTAATTPSSSTTYHSGVPQETIFQSNSLPFQVHPHRPVTSMPLNNDYRVTLADNNRRHGAGNVIVNQGYRPNTIVNQRPTGMGGGILVESTSNIVIPPDQDTVSFVLGNRQNVEGGYYSLGTAIGENPYSGSTGLDPSFRPLYSVSSDKINYDPDHKGTIGFPSVSIPENNSNYAAQTWRQPPPPSGGQKLANEIEPSRTQNSFVKGTVLLEQLDEKKEEKDVNYVVFPKDEPKQPAEKHVVVINEADGTSVHEPRPVSTTLKPSVPNEEHFSQLSENLTPPAERPKLPPQYYYHYHHSGPPRPDHLRPQRLPLPPRGKPSSSPPHPPPPPPSEPMGIRRRPYPDSSLPNILPQFRPNAKTSHGHRGSEAIGTIPAAQAYPTRVRQTVQPHPPTRRPLPPPPPPPPHLQRLNPPPPPIHALRVAGAASTKAETVVPLREEGGGTMKRFRLPLIPATSRGEDDVKLTQRVLSQKLRLEEEERAERYSEEPSQVPPRPPIFPKRRTADSPHIATLQMIQQHGEELEGDATEPNSSSIVGEDNDESDRIMTDQEADRRKFDTRDKIAEPPVYVVYPVNTAVNIHPDDSREKDESVVVGTRGPHRPLPPETLLQDNNEDQDEEPSPPVHSMFTGRPVVSDFPYPLERPDPSILVSGMRETPLLVPSDQRPEKELLKENTEGKDDKDSSVNVIPYLQDFVPFAAKNNNNNNNNEHISATLHRLPLLPSSTPIAYVYTPTAQISHRLDTAIRDDEVLMPKKNEQKPVLLPSQQPSSSSSSAPSPQNFMAPFVASVSAEAPSKNGWSVVMVESAVNRKSDDDSAEATLNVEETQTEKSEFDPESFKPQLFGGFKPIYEFPTHDEERRESSQDSQVTTYPQEHGNSTV